MTGIVQQFVAVSLMLLRLVLFALSLGLTIVSFQAYQRRQSKQLETAFIGFAFISMGVGLTTLIAQQSGASLTLLRIAETVPFIVGFSMLYLSLYR
ncbi:MAG: hypothetical protein V5A23_00365 [Halobacteriales archaeon]